VNFKSILTAALIAVVAVAVAKRIPGIRDYV
jgi:hypothetical protein